MDRGSPQRHTRMRHQAWAILFLGGLIVTAYQAVAEDRDFGEDATFLSRHVETIILGESPGGPRVAIVPAYQGRVMTSSATGDAGTSYGWINYRLIESGKRVPQIHVFGGEERFWLGPEGGQFSIFFAAGAKFDFAEWQTPAVIDTEAFEVVGSSAKKASFRHEARLKNYAGTLFHFRIERDVELLSGRMRSARRSISARHRSGPWPIGPPTA